MRHDTIESWRRDDRRLAWMNRLLGWASFAFLGAIVVFIFILHRTDFFYAILSIAGISGGLGRMFVWRVRGVPEPLRRLAHGAPADADAAWALIEAHRDELLDAAVLPGTIHEKPLRELDRAALVERIRRVGPGDGRRALRIFLVVWTTLALAVVIAVELYTPDPPQVLYRQ
jgi:hypothetical protein